MMCRGLARVSRVGRSLVVRGGGLRGAQVCDAAVKKVVLLAGGDEGGLEAGTAEDLFVEAGEEDVVLFGGNGMVSLGRRKPTSHLCRVSNGGSRRRALHAREGRVGG